MQMEDLEHHIHTSGKESAAEDGDTVFVREGTYTENIDSGGKNILLMGESRESTIIDGNQTGTPFKAINGENAVLKTLRLPMVIQAGEVVYYDNTTTLLIEDCIIIT